MHKQLRNPSDASRWICVENSVRGLFGQWAGHKPANIWLWRTQVAARVVGPEGLEPPTRRL
jgi:hypothetical protein